MAVPLNLDLPPSARLELGDAPPKSLLARLLPILDDLGGALDQDQLLSRLCRHTAEQLDAPAALVLLTDLDGLRVASVVGLPDSVLGGVTVPPPPELAARLFHGGLVVIGDLHRTLDLEPRLDSLLCDLRTVMAAPLRTRGTMVGVLAVAFNEAHRPLPSADRELLGLLAGHGGQALGHVQAYREAIDGQRRLSAVIGGLADGIAVLDVLGMVNAWNPAAERLTGLSAQDVVGLPFPLPLGTPDAPVEHHLGEGRWVEVAANSVSEIPDLQVVALRDISRQKALEAAKTMFVAATSHELKTPLTVIKSFAEWLRDNVETASPERRKLALDAVVSSADELHQIVEQILLTTRTEAGALDIDPHPVELGRLVEAVAENFSVVGKGHELIINRPGEPVIVRADVHAVRTGLGQLLENAFKYSPDGGRITVTAVDRHDGMAEISVQDEGIGLAPGEADYLYVAFYQGETRAKSRVRGGVGLGLSIVRRLAEAQGGSVGASGEPGQGARFWFTLPIDDLTTPDN